MKRLLRLPQVREAVGLSRSEILRLIALGRFPAPIKLGERINAWEETSVADWIQSRIDASKDRPKRSGLPAVRGGNGDRLDKPEN